MKREINGLKAALGKLESRMDAGFAKIDARSAGNDAKFNTIDSRFDGVDSKFDAVDSRFDRIDSRFDRLEEILRRVLVGLSGLSARVDECATRTEMNARFDGVNKRMDAFAGMLEDSRFRWAVHADVLTKHDKRLGRLEARRS